MRLGLPRDSAFTIEFSKIWPVGGSPALTARVLALPPCLSSALSLTFTT